MPDKRAGAAPTDGRAAPVRPQGSPKPARRAGAASSGKPGGPARIPVSGTPLAWTREGRLFPAPGPEAASLLVAYELVLKQVLPLRASHARDLPSAIQSLSAALTNERAAGPKPGYLSDPRMLSAYAWYFLPWNLYRLTRLVRGLALDIPDGAVVIDAGAGPLTFIQALWIAAPHLRSRRLTFVCLDRSRAALALGRELYLALAGDNTPWRVETVREELPRLPRAGADLLVCANVLNELAARRSSSLSDKTARMAESLTAGLAPGGRLLLVEPGVRASGKLLSKVRESLVEEAGLPLLAPCPHPGPCPLAARGTGTWCHFTVDAVGVPAWLETLSRRTGLPKRDVSLSFLFAGGQPGRADPALGRVVSNPFPVPGFEGAWARYACAAGGLRLYVTPSRGGLVPGDLARTGKPVNPVRDRKSGAVFYVLAAEQGGAGQARDTALAAASRLKGPARPEAERSEGGGQKGSGPKRAAPGKGDLRRTDSAMADRGKASPKKAVPGKIDPRTADPRKAGPGKIDSKKNDRKKAAPKRDRGKAAPQKAASDAQAPTAGKEAGKGAVGKPGGDARRRKDTDRDRT